MARPDGALAVTSRQPSRKRSRSCVTDWDTVAQEVNVIFPSHKPWQESDYHPTVTLYHHKLLHLYQQPTDYLQVVGFK